MHLHFYVQMLFAVGKQSNKQQTEIASIMIHSCFILISPEFVSSWTQWNFTKRMTLHLSVNYQINGPTLASFCLFSFFSITILQKNCRPQRDSNSDCWSRRRACWPLDHHHSPIIRLFMRYQMHRKRTFELTQIATANGH